MDDLLKRVEAAAGPDAELDAMLQVVLVEDREWQDDRFTIYAKNRKAPHDTYRVGTVDPGVVARNFTPYSVNAFPRYTSSIDAALGLVERLAPTALLDIHQGIGGRKWQAELTDGGYCVEGLADTLPLAILAALLRAKAQP